MADSGERIGPYLLAERITRGHRSSLFRGTRADGLERDPREVLLRVANEPSDPDVARSLLVEYEVLRAMQGDDRLPRAWGLYAGQGALALEWVPSVSLRDVTGQAATGKVDLELPTILDILIEVAYALRHVHAIVRPEGRLVHGALTSDVVRLAADGRVVVFGFGSREEPTLSPPEAALGVDHDPRSDQWQLGMLALELLRFVPDWAADPPEPDASAFLARVQATWPALGRVLAILLATQPTHRYEPEERMLKELLAVSRQLGGGSRRGEVAARTMRLVNPPRAAEPKPTPPPRAVTSPSRGPVDTLPPQRSPAVLTPTPSVWPAASRGATLPPVGPLAQPSLVPTRPPTLPPIDASAGTATLPHAVTLPPIAPVTLVPAPAPVGPEADPQPVPSALPPLAEPPDAAAVDRAPPRLPPEPSPAHDPFLETGETPPLAPPPRVAAREPRTPLLPDWVVMLAVAFLVAVGGTVLVLHLL